MQRAGWAFVRLLHLRQNAFSNAVRRATEDHDRYHDVRLFAAQQAAGQVCNQAVAVCGTRGNTNLV